ncbi:AbfB domain-containing protein [Streptomyces sp. NPDC048002]|uniref:AbfB domain-containing protein n=1 Tax=Streptomyces sp. NPDC048002 TaxID=3154344 RepID=UPI0033CB829D
MPHTPSRPPEERPWESGWAPDGSRVPGTRRLWLAGALALATIAGCVTAIAMTRRPADEPSPSAAPSTTTAPPGLISYASPSASTGASAGPRRSPSASRSPSATRTAPATAPSRTPARPSATSAASEPAPEPASEPTADLRTVRSVNYPDRSWEVSDGLVRLTSSPDAFELVEGLAEPSCYTFATADGRYLRHQNFVLRAERDDDSALFAKDATFCPRAGSPSGAVMLESVNYPGRYLRHKNFRLRLDPYQSSELFRADASFRLVG